MEFPRFVFISPGKHECQGGTYSQELVKSQEEYDAAVKAGFSATIPDALISADKARTVLKVAKPEKGDLEKPKFIHRQPKAV